MVLTRSELEIMDVLWDSQVPLSRGELLEQSTDKNWKDSSVHILLNGLLRKGAIREVGFVKRSKTYGRTFAPAMSRESYFATTIFSHKKKPDFVGLVAELLKRDDLSKEQLAQVLDLDKGLGPELDPVLALDPESAPLPFQPPDLPLRSS